MSDLIWAGGEDMDFSVPSANFFLIDNDSSRFRSGYARRALTTNAIVGISKSTPFSGGAVTSCWYSVQFKYLAGAATSMRFVGLGDSATTNKGLYIGVSSTSTSKYAIGTYDGSTWTELAVESGTSIAATLAKLDLQLISYGASATVNLYLNGNLIVTYSGDISISGVSGFDSVFIVGNAASNTCFSEHIVSVLDTRSQSLLTAAPNAAGDANAWSGAYTDINETTLNSATNLSVNTTAQDALFNLIDPPAGSFSVKGVRVAALCSKSSDSALTQVKLGIKSGGTVDVDAGHTVSTAPTETIYERIMDINPVTSSAFVQSEITPLQIAFRSLT